jgi:hypothetical protein
LQCNPQELRISGKIFPSPFAPFAPVTFPIGPVACQPLPQLQIEDFQFPILNSDVDSVVTLFWLRLAALRLCISASLR